VAEDRTRQPRCGRPRGRRAPGGPVRRRHHRAHQPRRQRDLPRHPPALRVPDHQAGRPAGPAVSRDRADHRDGEEGGRVGVTTGPFRRKGLSFPSRG
jgi:hypothetical protein